MTKDASIEPRSIVIARKTTVGACRQGHWQNNNRSSRAVSPPSKQALADAFGSKLLQLTQREVRLQ